MITHRSTIHGRCPLNGNWDYYDAEIRTDGFVDVAELEKALDAVRGSNLTQEDIANDLFKMLPADCTLKLAGRHSQNTLTTIEL